MADFRIGRWRRRSPAPDVGHVATTAAAAIVRPEAAERPVSFFIWSAFISILLVALAVRLYNVNWDENTHLHPDERFLSIVANDTDLPSSIGEYFNTRESSLNQIGRAHV